jgi:tyrosine-protein kinase Etk/Wzc
MAIEFITILDSRTFREGIIRRHNLIRYFKLTEPDTMKAMDRAWQKLAAQVLRIELEVQTSVLTLTVETKDKVLSRDIAQDCLASLEDYNQHRKLTKSKLLRQFLQGRVEETRVRLDSLSAAEKQFNLKHKTVAVDLQTQDVIKLYSDLVAQKFQAEIDLALAKTTRDASSPAVKELEEKQALLAAKITDLEKSNTKLFPKYILPMDDLPSLKLQYARLLLERSTAEQIYNSIYTQFETARIEELKAMPTMEIIDRPNLAGLRAKPKRALLIGLVTFAGLLLASTLSIILEFINTEQKSRIHSILRELRFRK